MSRNITTGTREKPKGSKQRLKTSSTQTPYGNKTSVSDDKETQITPQKANTPLRETMTKKTEGTVIRSVKIGPKKKRKRKLVEYDKARIYPPELGMTEEEMLRRGPMCKDCHKGHFGQVCPCNKCGWIHPHRGCLDRPFTPEETPTITKVPPENIQNKEIKLTVPIKGECWCWLCKSHGPEKICPRKDEIDSEYGRQRLKELLQEMIKPQENLGEEWNNNNVTSKVSQEVWLLETPSYSTEKGELIGPKIVQPPRDKTPHIKPVELGGGAQWPSKPTTTTPSESTGGVRRQDKDKNQLLGGVELGMIQRRNNHHPGLLLEGMVVEEVGEMVIMVVEMRMKVMVLRMRMMKIWKQSLRVRMGNNKMPQEDGGVNRHLILEVEMWDLGVREDIEVKEDGEVGQVHRVHQVHKDLKAHKV